MSDRPRAVAFIDESGVRGKSGKSSPVFILSAVVLPEDRRPQAARWLATMRKDIRRGPNDELHWKNVQSHADRMHLADSLGRQPFARIISVVTCKEHLVEPEGWDHDKTYMFAFRLLLERMTWLAKDREMDLHYTLAHIKGFKKAKLRQYEARLRGMPTKVQWSHVSPEPSKIDRPSEEEMLQIADVAASATGAAFNPDRHGRTETRYLEMIAPRLDRGPRDEGAVTSYGLKMHPWGSSESARAAYPWAAAL